MLLQRVDVIAVVRGILGRIVCVQLKNVDQHADVLEDRLALGGQVRVAKVKDKVAPEAQVVLLDADGRAEAQGERGGVVRAVERTRHQHLQASERDVQDEGSHGGLAAP
jgi:hypothetical protein